MEKRKFKPICQFSLLSRDQFSTAPKCNNSFPPLPLQQNPRISVKNNSK